MVKKICYGLYVTSMLPLVLAVMVLFLSDAGLCWAFGQRLENGK